MSRQVTVSNNSKSVVRVDVSLSNLSVSSSACTTPSQASHKQTSLSSSQGTERKEKDTEYSLLHRVRRTYRTFVLFLRIPSVSESDA